jgi:ketosteroid isomerase-like protein
MSSDPRERLHAAQAAFDDLFRHDDGVAMGAWFTPDAQVLWPDGPAIVGPAAIGQAFAEFATEFETISHQPTYDLVEVAPRLAVWAGTFAEVRGGRQTRIVERVYGKLVVVWRLEPSGAWRCVRLMTGRYAPTEVVDG